MFGLLLSFITTVILYAVVLLSIAVFKYFVKPLIFSKRDSLKGSWALVTGATDGIGKEFCIQLAKDNVNLILVSRTQAKLDALAKELEKAYKISTKTISCDFTKVDIYQKIIDQTKNEEISLLINNVGMSYDHPDFFGTSTEMTTDMIQSMINCNITSMATMTRLFLNKWSKDNKKHYIINIGSVSGLFATPLLSLYSGTKAFAHFFSRALHKENDNVYIQGYSPMFVVSKMSKIKQPSLFIPSASDYAKSALNMLGMTPVLTGYFWHEVAYILMSLVPECILVSKFFDYLNVQRKRFEKKTSKRK